MKIRVLAVDDNKALIDMLKEYSNGTFIVNDEIVTGAQTITQESYYYIANDYKYSASDNEDANKAYNILFWG